MRFPDLHCGVLRPSRHLPALAFCCTLGALDAQEPASNAGLDVATVQEFDRLDRNRDGSLDQLEFAFSEIAVRVREAGQQEALARILERIDRDADGGIGLLELVRSQHNRNVRLMDRPSSRGYIKSDSDQDGLISLGEYMERPSAKQELFRKIDLNDSKNVGPFEWMQGIRDTFMDQQHALVFSKLDRNDDGAISFEEFEMGEPPQAIAGEFKAVDLNGNREIAPAEFAKAMSLPEGQVGVPPRVLDDFEEIDRNRDHAISLREFIRYGPGSERGRGPGRHREAMLEEVFARLDANGDREISIAEFASRPPIPGPGGGPPGRGVGPGPGPGPGPGGGPHGPGGGPKGPGGGGKGKGR